MVYTKRIQEEEDWLKMSQATGKKGTIVLSTDVKKGTDKSKLGRNKNKRKETITCSGCNIPGHSINQCRLKEVECNGCGNKGHIKK
eukprot:Pgem_evm2s496